VFGDEICLFCLGSCVRDGSGSLVKLKVCFCGFGKATVEALAKAYKNHLKQAS